MRSILRAGLCALMLSAFAPAVAAADTMTLATAASDADIGGSIHDTATLSGGLLPTGTITFALYGPDDPDCLSLPVFTQTVNVLDNGDYRTDDFPAATAGQYNWTASYSGDAGNDPAFSACGSAGETSTVRAAPATLTSVAASTTIGGRIHDTATLSSGHQPTGTITFNAYGPDDPGCAEAVASTESVDVDGNGDYESPGFIPLRAGDYRWKVNYSGDSGNLSASSPCGEIGETSTVAMATPTLLTTPTDATIGDEIHDTATLSAGHDPGGTITFLAYGPGDASCTNPVFNSGTVDVSGDGSYSSGGFSPPASGTYRWKASYSGDGGNTEISVQCGAHATSTVTAARPFLASVASDATIGQAIHDTAVLSGGYRPGGTITFRAYGPANTDCMGTVAFNSGPIKVSGNGFYGSGDFSPPTTGTYRWTASYSGDGENASASSPCNSPNGTSSVALNDARPADQDKDGIPDSIDDCPMSPGPGKTNGCTAIGRALSLKYRRHAFRGTLTPADACGAEEKVTILAKRHGRTRKVGGARTNAMGRYTITAAKRKGSYYARSLNSLEPTVGLCLATQSKRILSR